MEVSVLLMQQIAQLFIVLLMGYIVVKTGLLKASDSKVLSVVFVYLVMPCVVLNAFQIDDTPQIRTGLLYSMGIAVGMHVVFLVLNAIFKKPLRLDVQGAGPDMGNMGGAQTNNAGAADDDVVDADFKEV